MVKTKRKISCVIIAQNEENSIARTLESVQWCDEIIVVDSGSTDNTLEICRNLGAKVSNKTFKGFGEQKRFAVSLSNNDWVLNIDADEVITEKLKVEIVNLLKQSPKEENVFFLPIPLMFMGKVIQSSKKKGNIRLFNKNFSNFSECEVHEFVRHSGEVIFLNNIVEHYSYEDLRDYFDKFNNYTSSGAKELVKKNKRIYLTMIPFRFAWTFFQNFIFKGMILKGIAGLTWSFVSACYPVVKYLKAYEIYKKKVKS